MRKTDNHARPGAGSILDRLKACPLPDGNATEIPFPLSFHGARMLAFGIREYMHLTLAHYREGELASYCLERVGTAIHETSKLRTWAQEIDPDYLMGIILDLEELFRELDGEARRLADRSAEEEGNP